MTFDPVLTPMSNGKVYILRRSFVLCARVAIETSVAVLRNDNASMNLNCLVYLSFRRDRSGTLYTYNIGLHLPSYAYTYIIHFHDTLAAYA